ncbi:MAG: hypothetical protein IJL29_01320 [Prevotella sp.]|nr:hypothetical protein [Prevotella sp.]MBP3827171.1 hypothetical protein [Prevotella sp.]MBQ4147606.1 hypothetical protein [Prevotella sp.]MBQ4446591.1 hypothetical protein [Prevotella sp.]MBQ6031645.1 hypothetical protein [Prevotella sp.]
MAKKKDLKKTINYICEELEANCVAYSLYNGKPIDEDVNALFAAILHTQSDFISRISHPEPGMPQKKYYRLLIEDFNTQVREMIDQICNLA